VIKSTTAPSYLGGTGTIGPISIGAGSMPKIVAPGGPATTGILATSGLDLTAFSANNSGFKARINGPAPGTGYDQLVVNGSVTLGSGSISLTLGYTPATDVFFPLIANDGVDPVSGTFSAGPEGTVLSPGVQLTYQGGNGNDVGVILSPCPSETIAPTVTAPSAATVTQTTCS
jgi:hypothetical protein